MFEPYNNKRLIGLTNISDKLFSDFSAGKLHHSLMFVGNNGIGKATLCYNLANKILDFNSSLKKNASNEFSLFGETPQKKDELDDNNPTFNLIKNKKHPDLLVIEKDVDAKTSKVDKEIKVAAARRISDFIGMAPFASKSKVVIIDSIDEMNIFAQNAILKVLEEPIKNTYIFLVCHNINNVLETIQSRCRRINIASPNFDNWKEILKYVYEEKYKSLQSNQLKELYSVSNGSISFALDIINEDGLFLYNHIENILSEKIPNVEDIQNLAEQLNNNDILYSLFSHFILLFLYKVLKYFVVNEGDDSFKIKNQNFIMRNNEKSILNKINLVKEILSDTDRFNLSRKHAVIVLFREVIK